MPLKPSSNDRSGFEYFTKEDTVRRIEREYRNHFMESDIIWLPFNSEDKPIYKILLDIYGNGYGKQVITNPKKPEWYNEELGCYDFWEWYNDKEFVRMILTQKVLVFDNPPFSGSTNVMRSLLSAKKRNPNLHFILFSDAMTGMNKVTSLHKDGGVGYHILGNVEFDNSAPDKRISIALFSDLFKEIKFLYGLGIDPRDKHGIQYWSQRCNLEKYRDERNGEISSAELINVCARGYSFKLDRFDFTEKCVKFGGCAKYKFETDEDIKLFNEKYNLTYNF